MSKDFETSTDIAYPKGGVAGVLKRTLVGLGDGDSLVITEKHYRNYETARRCAHDAAKAIKVRIRTTLETNDDALGTFRLRVWKNPT